MTPKQQPLARAWGVILAGGDGTRLRSLTEKVDGDARPKQFSRVMGDMSLLAQTRRRLGPLFEADRTIVVVTEKHEPFYDELTHDVPVTALLIQPENRGTGIAIATTALMLLKQEANAVVAFVPCDHHYHNEAAFLNAVEAGIQAAENSDSIVLLGAEPTYPETEYGWIEPVQNGLANSSLEPMLVGRFWEKPTLPTAQKLLTRGCLWNTFVTIGRASVFLELLSATVPQAVLGLLSGIAEGDLDTSFRLAPFVDFSRDVLASQMDRLLVIRDTASGWTDLGSPRRVLDVLARQKITAPWLKSFRGTTVLPVDRSLPTTDETVATHQEA